jgi:hypothetical protein
VPPVPQSPASTNQLLQSAPRIWRVHNRSPSEAVLRALSSSQRLLWTRRFEPLDQDADSLFADSAGRIITLQLFAAPGPDVPTTR